MSLGLRALANVPLIAVVDGVVAGTITVVAEKMSPDTALIEGWDAFKLMFWYVTIFGIIAGALLAIPFVVIGKYLPRPKWVTLAAIGAAMGPVYIMLVDPRTSMAVETATVFAGLGAMTGILWWLLVERHREEYSVLA